LGEWEKITNDKYVLSVVKEGVKMEFIEAPSGSLNSQNIQTFDPLECQAVSAEVHTFLQKGVIVETSREQGDYVSSIFPRTKSDGSAIRMILNLKKFNHCLLVRHCKLESIQDALNLITEGCYFGSIDLRDAYYSVKIDVAYQKFLKFFWDGCLYKYTALPNGFAPAVQIFTKLLKPPFRRLRELGHSSVKYLDDSLLVSLTFRDCKININDSCDLLIKLGFFIHLSKSVLEPVQRITFLGFVLDSIKMEISLTEKRTNKVIVKCNMILNIKDITIRVLAQVIGVLVSTFPAVPYGQLYYRNLEACKVSSLNRSRGNFDHMAYISKEAANELCWWKDNIVNSSAPIRRMSPSVTVHTDASLEGWGGTDGVSEIGGRWKLDEVESFHINGLELLACFLCLKALFNDAHSEHLLLKLDNTTAVAYINHKGGMRSETCNSLAKDIWFWAMERNIWLSAAHVPGDLNVIADLKSREFKDNTEWSLNIEMFDTIRKHFGKPEIDLFANRLNKKCSKFVSYKPEPGAWDVNAFSLNWGNLFGYIFAPFNITGRVLVKIQQDLANPIMVVPFWPSQSWYPQFLRMIDHRYTPLLLRPHRRLLQLPGTETLHPLHQHLSLLVARLQPKLERECPLQFATLSWRVGEEEPEQTMMDASGDGWHSARGSP